MSDPLFPMSSSSSNGRRRVRSRAPSSTPQEPPRCLPRTELQPTAGLSVRRGTNVCRSQGGSVSPPPSSSSLTTTTTATSSAPVSNGWQYASSSRCLVCGQLGCTSCSTRLDPDVKRQKLESLKMNTPYERAKLLRAAEEVRQDEMRRRQRLYEAWHVAWMRLRSCEAAAQHALKVAELERRGRAVIMAQESDERRTRVAEADSHSLLMALNRHEQVARHALATEERAERALLRTQCDGSRAVVELQRRELCGREHVQLTEAAEREVARAREADARLFMQTCDAVRWALIEDCLSLRDAVVAQQAQEVEQLAARALAHRAWLDGQLQEREAMYVAAEREAVNLLSIAEMVARNLKKEMAEAGYAVRERASQLANAIADVAKEEDAARNVLISEYVDALHEIFLASQASIDAAHAAAQRKRERRSEELHTALAHLHCIAAAESTAFTTLLAEERAERERRLHWIAQKEVDRGTLAQHCISVKSGICRKEEDARRVLLAACQQAEMELAEHLAAFARHARELLAHAIRDKDALRKEEHDARFCLLSFMGEHEEGVRRWAASRAQERTAVLHEESELRTRVEQQEAERWEELAWTAAAALEALEARAKQCEANVLTFCTRALQELLAIAEEEAGEYERLCALESEYGRAAFEAAVYREQVGLLQEEAQQRSFGVQLEVSERAGIVAKAAMSLHFALEQAAGMWRAQRHEVEALEEANRKVLVQEAIAHLETMWRMMLREAAGLLDARRIAREAEMREDPRVSYDATESLVFETSTLVSLLERGDTAASRTEEGYCEEAASTSVNDAYQLKMSLCLQALGVPASACQHATISQEAVEGLASLLDAIGARRAAASASLALAERKARDAARKTRQLETQLAAEREKKVAYAAKAKRDAEDRKRRLEQDQTERRRGVHQLQTERKRLDTAEAQLRVSLNKLDSLRKGISNQYK